MAEKRRVQEPPIRIKSTSRATMQRIADAIGVPYIQVVDWAVEALGAYFDAHGGKLLLPLDFRQRFTIHANEPLILHEPPVPSVRSELGSREGGGRTNKPAQKATARD